MAMDRYYREEARRCRVRAAREPNSGARVRLLQLASDYELLADELEEAKPSPALFDQARPSRENQHYRGGELTQPVAVSPPRGGT